MTAQIATGQQMFSKIVTGQKKTNVMYMYGSLA
jgi:hypothetical protein